MAHSASPQAVANDFVRLYYTMLHDSPEEVHKFYGETSKLARPEQDGSMSTTTTTMQTISDKIQSLTYDQLRIRSVDAQESHGDGVLVVVTGSLTEKVNTIRDFSHTFFLAPQKTGYFVLNDVFCYIQPEESVDVLATEDEVPAAEEVPVVTEDEVPVAEEVQKADDVVVAKVEAPAAEEARKADDVPKTYASLVKDLKESGATFTSPPRPAVLKNAEKVAPRSSPVDDNGKKGEASEVYKIYINNLPMNATESMVEEEFNKFGAIKKNGIQVRSAGDKCFGFVEFEMPSAVQKAIRASPVQVGERRVYVQEKRSNNSSSRPRIQPGNKYRGTSSSNHQNLNKPSSSYRGTSSSGNQNLSKPSSASDNGHNGGSANGVARNTPPRLSGAGGSVNGVARNIPPRLSATATAPTTKPVYRKKQ